MTKTEMARQLAAAANEKHIERMAQQLEALRQSKARSVEELAQQLEPLAQAMAALTDETKHTLEAIEQRTQAQAKDFDTQSQALLEHWKQTAQHSKEARRSLEKASRTLEWRFLLLTIAIGVISGGLTSASLLWLLLPRFLPPVMLDTQAVAQSLLQHFPTQPPSPPAKPSGNSSTR